jgi:hypothetical protein
MFRGLLEPDVSPAAPLWAGPRCRNMSVDVRGFGHWNAVGAQCASPDKPLGDHFCLSRIATAARSGHRKLLAAKSCRARASEQQRYVSRHAAAARYLDDVRQRRTQSLARATQNERERHVALPLIAGEASVRTRSAESTGTRPARERAAPRRRQPQPRESSVPQGGSTSATGLPRQRDGRRRTLC